MYVSRNNEVHLSNHCCSRREINIAYSEGVFVASGIQHAMCTLHTIICDLSGSTIFFHIISSMAQFFLEGGVTANKMCFDFLYTFCLKHFSF